MRFAVVLACLVGCNGVPSGPFAYDVVVREQSIEVYTGGRDLNCTCKHVMNDFPKLGECGGWSDVVSCGCDRDSIESCITSMTVESDGMTVSTGFVSYNLPHFVQVAPGLSDPVLVIEGCGQGVSRIAIPTSGLPQPTITQLSPPTVAWTSDPPAPSALVSSGNLYGGTTCHVAGSPFELHGAPDYVSVQVLAAPRELDTPLGHATVWYGGEVSVDMAPSP